MISRFVIVFKQVVVLYPLLSGSLIYFCKIGYNLHSPYQLTAWKEVFFCILFFLTAATTSAQDKLKIKFGSVTADDFKTTVYPIDSNATAIIVADIGSTEIIGNTKGSFSLLFNNYRRAHILNKNGYNIGDVQISLYTNGESEEELENLKAVTYNLENGKVVQTKLEIKSAVFKDKVSKNLVVKNLLSPI